MTVFDHAATKPAVERALNALQQRAATDENTMALLMKCAHWECTIGEMCDAFKDVFRVYMEAVY